MRKHFLILVSLALATLSIQAQQLEYRLGYLMIQVQPDVSPEVIAQEYSARLGSPVSVDRTLSNRLRIYLLRFDHAAIHQTKLLNSLRSDARIEIAQYDHLLTYRNVPNDPLLNDQWQWLNTGQTGGTPDADIDADRAWDITTGGVTALGDTIVVAIVDDGLDYNHEDIAANAWINYGEIDGNGVDDDGNGYIDDYRGWNAFAETGDVWGNNHGLAVAGMVGAVGNNSIGVTGINWNVKLMTIIGGSPESAAIASYSYALEQRIAYNESNGDRGAFVVVTNSSWGIDEGQPADAPLWCAFYDTLGVHGILSAAATANREFDIDVVSDLPTGCPSEYLLSVTALNHSNERTFSAWGLTTIDFGAPGEDIFTTERFNGYDHTSGTSFASPTTAGVVALMYSAPCVGFAALVKSNPEAAAKYVRDLIFEGVEPIDGLASTIRFGGSLNAGNSVELMMALCTACPLPLGVNTDTLSDTLAVLSWSLLDTADAIHLRYRPVGGSDWDTIANVSNPYTLTGLLGCTAYEIEFESECADTTTGYQTHFEFETDGCCELPASTNYLVVDQDIYIDWTNVLAAEYYLVQWRQQGDPEWTEVAVNATETVLSGLASCTYYEVRLLTSCDTTETGFSEIETLRTQGCGNCIDLGYCEASSDDASEEFIDSLIIGPLVNHSGNNGGYILFEDPKPLYVAGETYAIWLRPGFGTPIPFREQFRIWIDFDQDGNFDEEEMVLDSILQTDDDFIAASFTVPDTATAGASRMRVSMAFTDDFFITNQPPCGTIEFGEIEDYCIRIATQPDPCPEVDSVYFDGITFTGAFMYWPSVDNAIAYTYRYREVGSDDYDELATIDTTANLSGLKKCTMYEVQVRTVCLFDTTGYITNYILETECDVAVTSPGELFTSLQLFPNPTVDHVTLQLTPKESGEHQFALFNLQGQRLHEQQRHLDANTSASIQFNDLSHYPSGLYFIRIGRGEKWTTQKLIKL